jgi:cytochrome subunit of sulfide dehydrogenase
MKNTRFYITWLLATSVSLAISANAAEVVVSPASQSNNQHIRTLAASCAACHGSNGNAVAGSAVLAGMDAQYFSKQMLAFKDGSRPATVMHHHAKGLNVDEIDLLALYFSQQKRVANVVPATQILKADNDN